MVTWEPTGSKLAACLDLQTLSIQRKTDLIYLVQEFLAAIYISHYWEENNAHLYIKLQKHQIEE